MECDSTVQSKNRCEFPVECIGNCTEEDAVLVTVECNGTTRSKCTMECYGTEQSKARF